MNLPSPAHQSAWSDKAFRRFWKRMGDVFGTRWYEHNGPEPSDSWKNGLSQHKIEHVLMAIVGYETTAHGGFPPNLPQFLEEVRAARRRLIPSDKALPAPKRNSDHLDRISAGLKSARDYAAKVAARFKSSAQSKPFVPNDDHFEGRK